MVSCIICDVIKRCCVMDKREASKTRTKTHSPLDPVKTVINLTCDRRSRFHREAKLTATIGQHRSNCFDKLRTREKMRQPCFFIAAAAKHTCVLYSYAVPAGPLVEKIG